VQYTYARAQSILKKSGWTPSSVENGLKDSYSWELTKLLNDFPPIIKKANSEFDPSAIAKHIMDVCQHFNSWYGKVKFLQEDSEREARLALVSAASIVIKEGLRLLVIHAPQEM
jgi:arginyl-tRNA synthetase